MSGYKSSFALLDVQDSSGVASEDEEDVSPAGDDSLASQVTSPLSKKARARRRAGERKAAARAAASLSAATTSAPGLPPLQPKSITEPTQASDSHLPQSNGSHVPTFAEVAAEQAEPQQHESDAVETAKSDHTFAAAKQEQNHLTVEDEGALADASASSLLDEDSTEDEADMESSSDDEAEATSPDASCPNAQNDNAQMSVSQGHQTNGMVTPPRSPLGISTQETPDAGFSAQTLPATPSTPLSPSGHRRSRSRAAEDVVAPQSKDHAPGNKWRAIITRTIWTFFMLGGFILILLLGHAPVILIVFAIQAQVFRELTDLFDVGSRTTSANVTYSVAKAQRKAQRARYSKVLSWYFFAVTNYYLYGETIIYYFKHIVLVDAYFIPFAKHHRFISLSLYILGFVGFVSTLKKETARRQFGLFCWIHVSLFLVVVSAHFIVDSVLEGLIWFWMSVSLVICNDIWAYICGMAFGKTPLIQLSPKKTVEGFVGGFFMTILFGYAWATLFMRFPYFVCPCKELGTTAWNAQPCDLNPAFLWHSFELPAALTAVLPFSIKSIPWAPFQFHTVALAVFASLIAPFGGFFASGFKRAFNIKDFGDSIPGHGGMTDRMDCQFMMGMWSYFYYVSMVRVESVSVATLLQSAVSSLSRSDQQLLAEELFKYVQRTS